MPVSVPTQSDHDAVEQRVGALESQVPDDHSAQIAALEQQVSALQAEAARLDARLDAIAGAAGD